MFKRLALFVSILFFVFAGQVSAQEATPESTPDSPCLSGYITIPGYRGLCYHPTGGDFNFSYSELLSGEQTDVTGTRSEVSRIGCPITDESWAYIELTGVQLCLPRDRKAFYLVSDLLNGETSSFPEMKPYVLIISKDADQLVEITSFDTWYKPSVSDEHMPNLLEPQPTATVGHPQFVFKYWGQLFAAVLDTDGTIHFVPMRENMDQTEDWSWMGGLTFFELWGDEVTQRVID